VVVLSASQQPDRIRHIGLLTGLSETDPETQTRLQAFRESLRKLGWVEERNLQIENRFTAGDSELLRDYATELVRSAPDVILANGNSVLEALQRQTRTLPIVFVQVPDPVVTSFVTSLAHPGGNATGLTNFEQAMGGKWLELLREVAPGIKRVRVLFNPSTAIYSPAAYSRSIEAAATSLGVESIAGPVHDSTEIEGMIKDFANDPMSGLIALPDIFISVHRELIVALTNRYRVPAVYPYRYFATSGGLMSYGIDTVELYRQAASYVDRILRGANPGDLPVQAPTKFELVINLKTAKELGLDVPLHLQQLADEVIE